MNLNALALVLCLSLLGACGDKRDDLRQWMLDQGQNARGKIDSPPTLKPYEPFNYNAFELQDPFKPRKIELSKSNTNTGPDLTRRKEALEAFPLENLRMVGTLEQKGDMYAMVRTNDNRVYQVKKGQYLGQNYGVISAISDAELVIKELIQDGSGDWTERPNKLSLIEAASPNDKGQKK